MDTTSTIDLLTRLNHLAQAGELCGREDLVAEVQELRNFAEYQCKLDRAEYNHVFAAAAQAHFLVADTGLPAFEDTTYQRVIEHSALATEAILDTSNAHTSGPGRH
ncbi:hypothetical protein G6L37_00365 [Agrobacterium rubi]|nr:hypothetical protein [Agrobacterium rubi]NTF23842.1 hypothetical protein [Agrobacterium rubi]